LPAFRLRHVLQQLVGQPLDFSDLCGDQTRDEARRDIFEFIEIF